MAHRTDDHSDMTLFKNRLWKLMEDKHIYTTKALAKMLYSQQLVTVKQKHSYDEPSKIYSNAIGAIDKKIQKHLNADTAEELQGEFVIAYSTFFGCSSDYLFGFIDCQTHDIQFIQNYIGLSEDAINNLKFIQKLNNGEIFLFILSRLIENRDFSINLMNEINNCFEKYYYYDSKKKLSDALNAESGDDIIKFSELLNSEEYKNVLSRKQIEELRDAKDSKIYRTHVHFLNILDSFLSNRIKELNKAPDTNQGMNRPPKVRPKI